MCRIESRIFLVLFLSLTMGSTFSMGQQQDSLITNRSLQYFTLLSLNNPWLNMTNPAGLSVSDISSVNMTEITYRYADKDIHFAQEPGLIHTFNAHTKGYRKIGRVSFYGDFGYHNEHYNRLKYNNTLVFDPNNPYLLGDTIPGRQRKEGYSLEGTTSLYLSEKMSAGLRVYYLNSTGAKQKDPRNLNKISHLVVTPGITYMKNNTIVGLSAGPELFNNDVSVSVTENAKYNLFQFMGLGYFKSVQNIYSYSNGYYGSGVRANFQLALYGNRIESYTDLGYRRYKEEVRYGNTDRLLDAISTVNSFTINSVQKLSKGKSNHMIEADIKGLLLSGTEINQDFVRVIMGLYSYDSLVTLSWVDNRHTIDNFSGRLQYRFIRMRSPNSIDFEAFAGVSGQYYSSSHYPVENWGFFDVATLTGNFGFRKAAYIRPRLTIIPEGLISYRLTLYKDMGYNIVNQSLPEFPLIDYRAFNYEHIMGAVSLTALFSPGTNSIGEYFIKGSARWSQPVGSDNISGKNLIIDCSLGLIF